MNPLLHVFSDRLRETEAPGWWRTGSDLDGLADQAQHRLADGMRLTIPRARANGQFHTFTTSGSGDTGGWLLILAVADDTPESRNHLRDYLIAKKPRTPPTGPWGQWSTPTAPPG